MIFTVEKMENITTYEVHDMNKEEIALAHSYVKEKIEKGHENLMRANDLFELRILNIEQIEELESFIDRLSKDRFDLYKKLCQKLKCFYCWLTQYDRLEYYVLGILVSITLVYTLPFWTSTLFTEGWEPIHGYFLIGVAAIILIGVWIVLRTFHNHIPEVKYLTLEKFKAQRESNRQRERNEFARRKRSKSI